jgi:peroxiredoxin
MERLKALVDDEGFEIVAVSVDARIGERDTSGNPGGDLAAFMEEYGLTFTILHDPSGDIQRLYQTTGVPESFLIGRDRVIYRRMAGPTEWDARPYVEAVGRLLDTS